ncbi:hypothetical protein RRG08_005444 [Elysia crispata]|uniref:Uncharacterized protein n=1 Tax=Elysia crispata TaxID=231223 RepID=A0AAE1CQL1_9GAST|nr:hypothetical protein RRG08_005444 [Elysia crispata]
MYPQRFKALAAPDAAGPDKPAKPESLCCFSQEPGNTGTPPGTSIEQVGGPRHGQGASLLASVVRLITRGKTRCWSLDELRWQENEGEHSNS